MRRAISCLLGVLSPATPRVFASGRANGANTRRGPGRRHPSQTGFALKSAGATRSPAIYVRRHPSQTGFALKSAGATRAAMVVVSVALGMALLLPSTPAWAGKGAGTFEAANEKYKAGDFKAAASAYDEILKSGQGTSAVQFNLGNALLRSGKKAPALLAYYRALRAEPRNRDLRWNIGVVESLLADRPSDDGSFSWKDGLRRLTEWIAIDETGWILLGLSAGLAILGWLGFMFPGRPLLGRLQFSAVVLLIIGALLFAVQWKQEGRDRILVMDPEVTLRYGPAFSETKAFVLHEGAAADVLDESGDWWYVSFGKNSGWLPKKSCEII